VGRRENKNILVLFAEDREIVYVSAF